MEEESGSTKNPEDQNWEKSTLKIDKYLKKDAAEKATLRLFLF